MPDSPTPIRRIILRKKPPTPAPAAPKPRKPRKPKASPKPKKRHLEDILADQGFRFVTLIFPTEEWAIIADAAKATDVSISEYLWNILAPLYGIPPRHIPKRFVE